MRLFRQVNNYSCAPRALQTALSHYKMYPKYSEIASLCGTDETGTDLELLEQAVSYYGLVPKSFYKDASIARIESFSNGGYPIIVMWDIGDNEAHVGVVCSTDDVFIYLLDPAMHLYAEPTIVFRKTKLIKCWENHPSSKWMMAILPS